MQSILDRAPGCLAGTPALSTAPDGATPHRTPGAARVPLADRGPESVSAIPSGVRLEMLTVATKLELDARPAAVPPPGTPPAGAIFDLVADGTPRAPAAAAEQTVVVLDPDTVRLHPAEGTALFGPGDLARLPDGLHPDAAGYARMAEWFPPVAFGGAGVHR